MAKNKTILQLDELTKPKGSDNFVVASTDNDFRLSLQTLQDAIGTNVVDPKIKELQQALNGKAGAFHNDEENNRCLVFADSESRSAYLADTSRTDLILGVINVGADMGDISGAIINLQSPMYNTIRLGSTGNYISFTFDITNKNGMSTGEPATCTYTFRKASNVQTVTEQYPAGKAVRFNIDKYLSEGTNQITVNIQGVDTGASVSVGVTYQVVSLTLSCDYNLAQVYNLSNSSQTLSAEFTVSGYGSKQLEWYIDGEKLAFDSIIDEVVTESAIRTKYIQLSDMQNGVHNLQVRARTTVDGEVFYSDTEYREFMVHNGVSTTPLAAIAMTVPSEYGIISEKRLYSMQQYVSYDLEFATYNPESSTIEVSVLIDDAQQGLFTSENGTANKITLSPIKSGEAVLKLVLGEQEYTINADIAQSSIAVTEISNALQLDFRALGKSNNATDKDIWSYGDYTGEFNGFNWNSTSGWVNNALHINAGATFDIDLAPLGVNPATLGKTIEIEFASTNVNDDNAVLLDLTNADGTGLLITATNIKLTSQAGVTIETSYKDNEFIRVAFVINKSSGATNKCLSFIYINGIVSRGVAWASTDKYTSNKTLHFVGSEGAEMLLKSVRIYDMALTSDQVLNNYTLYRDTAAEMIDVYERNDVYADNSSSFDYTKMMSRLPVMVITGNIPALEATSDKNLQITVDVEYFNLQDPSRSFKMKNAALRPQGTSSMGYPKKNFRLYTEKRDDTEVYDANGYKVENKKYAFTKNAQPVNCWCFKADYAESSGTHNTGIARLWNDVLVNTKIDEDYKLRTTAQKAAIAANYDYDVRTTIDGFPILMFYRLSENDPLVFIGKYNFNNDKSTESVFGFVDIPGFDNAKMQCWEVLNNGNALALFTSVDNFDANWSDAFESRYPDTSDPDTSDLKAFCQWMTSVSAEDFKTQKWSHLDIYKVAAYYVYLMRFGAVDQTVKNSMFTSEDGEHFYFINYDNDTINGLTNEGKLVVPWNATRTTLGEDGEPYYAGPRSRLWNMLEADEEFMNIVRTVDEALYVAGLRYESVIEMFDDKQAAKWVERVYNQDAQYKYIGPFVDKGINNLFMLQGDRSTHRKYWLAKRFNFFDSKFVSGAYKAQSIELKCINNTPVGQQFSIIAGTEMDYGYGINNNPREANITLAEDESHTFTTSEVVNLGDPIRIYAAPHIKALDLSAMTDRLAVVTISNVNDDSLGSKFKKLIIGNPLKENTTVEDISGLTNAEKLEYLDVRNMKGLTSLNLANQISIQYIDALGSNIANIEFAKGAALQTFKMPSAMQTMQLEQLPYLSSVVSENNFATLRSIYIKNCPYLTSDFNFIRTWLTNTQLSVDSLELEMTGVDWNDITAEDLISLGTIGRLSLKGKATISAITQEQIDALTNIYGENCFKQGNEFRIVAPDGLFISSDNSVKSGRDIKLSAVIFSDNPGKVTWSITSGTGASIKSTNGVDCIISTTETTTEREITVQAKHSPSNGNVVYATKVIKITKTIRATSGSINGPSTLSNLGEFSFTPSPSDYNEPYSVEWSVTGDAATSGYVSVKSQNGNTCEIQVTEKVTDATFNVVASVNNGSSTFSVSKEVTIGVKLVINIRSNQDDDEATFANTKAMVVYNDTTTTMGNGDELRLAAGTEVKITFPNVSDYKTPDGYEFVMGDEDAIKVGEYLTEAIEIVGLRTFDGEDISSIGVKVAGVNFSLPYKFKCAHGENYTISYNWKSDKYLTPIPTTGCASTKERKIITEYIKFPDSAIIIDQSISDPEAMISGNINNDTIKAIRAESHNYLGKYTANGVMTICQLSDNDMKSYSNGTSANIYGNDGNLFMRMPRFWYRISSQNGENKWAVDFRKCSDSPDDSWLFWDENSLIGVNISIGIYGNKLLSVESVVGNSWSFKHSYADVLTAVRTMGTGFQLVDWQMHCVMALLYYAQYGHTNCRLKIGTGVSKNSASNNTGVAPNIGSACIATDTRGTEPVLGLNDNGLDGDSRHVVFWGLNMWWGFVDEYMQGIESDASAEIVISDINGRTRSYTNPTITSSNYYVGRFVFGKYGDLVPINRIKSGNSSNFCTAWDSNSASECALRGGRDDYGSIVYIEFQNRDYIPSGQIYGTRLAFRGKCIIENDPEVFKSLVAIS